ncbi:MAG: zinc-binding dehydrogenase [Candidatus Kryptoniota bacterium]
MRRWSYRITKPGSFHNLKLVEEELSEVGENEVRIEVKAIGLNFADLFTILGLYKAAPKKDFIPGLEFSGIIVEKGKRVNNYEINDRVMGSIRFGSYTTHLNIDHRYITRIPDDWSFEEGASFIVQALTAYYALLPMGGLKEGQTVLIHSVAGGVGVYANRIAKKFNAYTIGTVGSPSKADLARKEGCDAVIIRSRNFKGDLRKALNGRPLDLVLDSIGGRIQRESFDMLSLTGRLVAYGLSQFATGNTRPNYFNLARQYFLLPRYHTLELIESNKSVLGFNLIWLYDRVDMLKAMLDEIVKLRLKKPYVGDVFQFDQMLQAIHRLQSGKTTGKVVVKID